ncbi:hypothetical protein [Peptoniphilus sp.]|uniref:hypothetical protein n=1 Tax=Peptoniphilus sp. TaxID=1971214 RepID=UPI003995ACB6
MSDYKKILVCIPCSSFKEQMKAASELIDDGYNVETSDGYVIGIKTPKNRRRKYETD